MMNLDSYTTTNKLISNLLETLSYNKEKGRYELGLSSLMGYISNMEAHGILSWTDRQYFFYQQNPEQYVYSMFDGCSLDGKPVRIVI